MSDNNENLNSGAGPHDGTGTPWTAPAPPPPAPLPPARNNGGIWAGVILIAIGAIFLAGQVLPGLAWWNLWPLIVVLVGVIQMFTPNHKGEWGSDRVLDGLGTVIIGGVFLGNTLGVISWTVWWTFITLWPVLIVALGVSLLGRGLRQSWIRALSPLLVWAALGYSVVVSFTGASGLTSIPAIVQPSATGENFSYSEQLGDTSTAAIRVRGGAGEISMRGGDSLVSASGVTPYGTPELSVARDGQAADIDLTLAGSDGGVMMPGLGSARADVELARTVIWDTTIETGASALDADFSDVPLRRLTLSTGGSSSTVKLGRVPSTAIATDIAIKAGVASITILVPSDAEVRIDTQNGLSATDVDRSFKGLGGGVWQTPGYESASKTINISLESGISSISVRTY
ncbi:MAG: hypothetical protein HGB10_06440 [Coriobacteriia bacterium]|nr:hypothetical protein [Coriobacteriia bacterium]